MHEVSLVHALFDQADRAIAPHPPGAVRKVTVRIGTLAGVENDLFATAFEGCRTERGYSGAELAIVDEAAEWRCRACSASVAPGGPLRCASCDGEARLSAGGEIVLERLELEVMDV